MCDPMPPASLTLPARVKEFFSVYQFKLFHQDGDYVACFGEPATTDDGWILNLPASHVFEGDYHSLPFETYLNATWAHTQVMVRDPLSNYLCHNNANVPWATKAANAGIEQYQHADLFRDAASVFSNAEQNILALAFIEKAHSLRPNGPLIIKMREKLRATCFST